VVEIVLTIRPAPPAVLLRRRLARTLGCAERSIARRMKRSTKYTIVILASLLCLLALYEAAFRLCTGAWGEINTDTSPVSLYYSCDLLFPGKPMETVFFLRAKLPLGKVPLAEGTGAYISGGTFFRKASDGTWEDVTEAFKRLRSERASEAVHEGESP